MINERFDQVAYSNPVFNALPIAFGTGVTLTMAAAGNKASETGMDQGAYLISCSDGVSTVGKADNDTEANIAFAISAGGFAIIRVDDSEAIHAKAVGAGSTLHITKLG